MSKHDDLKDKLQKLRSKWYGTDALGMFLLFLCVLLQVVAAVTFQFGIGQVFSFLSLVILILQIFRTFSTNKGTRLKENNKFLELTAKPSKWFHDQQYYHREGKKGYVFLVCPSCKGICRVPKNKGKIKITCPHCGKVFVKKT
ncbi:MAG: hypothetical protein LKE40_14305 [Spirochaetia bacterium]|jgi:uncharacterized C2H2 Zn-finger protein|nr:hypothetical protein [Spirochaetia bacterium]